MRQSAWQAALDHRVAEAFDTLGSVPGVRGLVLGGSVGRGEAWPLSDVDLVVVYEARRLESAAAEFERRRGLLEGFWSWSQVPGSLDAGFLSFTDDEVADVVAAPPAALADRLPDPRWMHVVDKASGGRAAPGSDPLVAAFADLLTDARFRPEVVAARREYWRSQAHQALADGRSAIERSDRRSATLALHTAVEATIEVVTEGWGERSSSLGRRYTRFERLARQHRAIGLAGRLLALRGARPRDVRPRLAVAPWWLRCRIEAAMTARRQVGEPVSAEENARDQLVAFATLWQRRELPPQLWSDPRPRRDLPAALTELDALITTAAQL